MLSLGTDRPREARDLLRRSGIVRTASLFGDTVHALLAPGEDPRSVVDALERGGLAVTGARQIEPSLEDLFIHLVRRAGERSDAPAVMSETSSRA